MPELIDELDKLARTWLAYIEENPVTRDDLVFSRTAGYLAGLQVCADQVMAAVRRAAQNA